MWDAIVAQKRLPAKVDDLTVSSQPNGLARAASG